MTCVRPAKPSRRIPAERRIAAVTTCCDCVGKCAIGRLSALGRLKRARKRCFHAVRFEENALERNKCFISSRVCVCLLCMCAGVRVGDVFCLRSCSFLLLKKQIAFLFAYFFVSFFCFDLPNIISWDNAQKICYLTYLQLVVIFYLICYVIL